MNREETCDLTVENKVLVQNIQEQLPADLKKVAQLFKALADETRLKIAYILTIEDEVCVCDIAASIGCSIATASHHLRYLKQHSLAKSSKKGKMVYYSLADNHVHEIIQIAYTHAEE